MQAPERARAASRRRAESSGRPAPYTPGRVPPIGRIGPPGPGGMGSMRVRASVFALVLLVPLCAAAEEQPTEPPRIERGPGSPAECARLEKQIHYFEDM